MWQNFKTQIVTKLKLWQNLKCEEGKKNQKLKYEEEKTQKLKMLQNSNCDITWNFNIWQNSKNLIVTKLKNSKCDKTQKLKLWQNLKYEFFYLRKKKFKGYISKNMLTPWQPILCSLGSVCDSCDVFFLFMVCMPSLLITNYWKPQ